MYAIFDFSPNYCPFCNNHFDLNDPESVKQKGEIANHFQCSNCEMIFQIGSKDDLLTMMNYSVIPEDHNDYELIIGTKPYFVENLIKGRQLKVGDWWEVALIIDPDTTIDNIRDGWQGVKSELNAIQAYQGRKQSYDYQFFSEFSQLNELGWTHKQIAEQINFDCLVHFFRLSNSEGNNESKQIGLENMIGLLRFTKMPLKRILEYLNEANISNNEGQLPWTPKAGIVDQMRVTKAFSLWRDEQQTKNIVPLFPGEIKLLPALWVRAIHEGYWRTVDSQLQKDGIERKDEAKERFDRCMKVIEKNMKNFG